MKEFKRSVCFQFFEGWHEQAKMLRELYDDATALNFLLAVQEYGLYQVKPEEPLIQMLLAPITAQIDSSQQRRERGFNKENTEQTKMIIDYCKHNPKATQREIAEACGVSLGKVNKVIKNNNVNNVSNSVNMNSGSSVSSGSSANIVELRKIYGM